MSNPPTLGCLLESFFHRYLVEQRNASPVTLASYRDALRLLILFAAKRTARKPCQLTIADLDRDLVLDFLNHLEQARDNSVSTRNARLTAVRSFFHYVASRDPASMGIAQRILAIPGKRTKTAVPQFLEQPEVDALLDAPDRQSIRGRRDHVLLLFLVRTGARISEALGVDAVDLHLDPPPQVLLRGKGRKQRMIPLVGDLAKNLAALCRERGIGPDERSPIFVGVHGERLTRFGAIHIVRRAAKRAAECVPQIARVNVSPHLLRHTLAMRLLRSGADLVTIQAWLGHAQVATTHRYAEADVEMMRRSLEQAHVTPQSAPRFRPRDSVLQILENR
ncbi:MAG: tyrosine-type recombinase/integrase [Pseudomonadales bacterium]